HRNARTHPLVLRGGARPAARRTARTPPRGVRCVDRSAARLRRARRGPVGSGPKAASSRSAARDPPTRTPARPREDPMKLATVTIETPLGRYALVASEAGLVQAKPTGAAAPVSGAANSGAERMLARARAAFERYFAGAADAFASLPVDPQGSEFQRRVWRALREIPLGATASYGEIARKVGSPAAARAVGDANRRNPIAIAIPCHRVIGGDGHLVGYAGGLA